MLGKLIKDLLSSKGINNIDQVEFTNLDIIHKFKGSHHEFAIVKFKDDRNDLHLFLKVCTRGSPLAALNSQLCLFDKEKTFYEELLPRLIKFQNGRISKGNLTVPIDSLFFNYFGSGVIDEDIYIVFERFSDDEYYVTGLHDFHNEEQIHSAMRALASFHAVSYCMSLIENLHFPKEYPILEEKVFSLKRAKGAESYFMGNYTTNIKLLKSVINESQKENPVVAKHHVSLGELEDSILKRLECLSENVMLILHKICSSSDDKTAVVSHGDFHMWNIAFNKKDVNNVKLFDFQIIRYASALLDVNQYLYQVCTVKTRKTHLHAFLNSYCNAFQVACEEHGLDQKLNHYTIDFVSEEYLRTSPWGFLYGFSFLMYRFIPSDVYSSFSTLEDSCKIVGILDALDGSEKLWEIIKVYVDLILEAESNGTITIMEGMVSK